MYPCTHSVGWAYLGGHSIIKELPNSYKSPFTNQHILFEGIDVKRPLFLNIGTRCLVRGRGLTAPPCMVLKGMWNGMVQEGGKVNAQYSLFLTIQAASRIIFLVLRRTPHSFLSIFLFKKKTEKKVRGSL